jgi:hypothetical protein
MGRSFVFACLSVYTYGPAVRRAAAAAVHRLASYGVDQGVVDVLDVINRTHQWRVKTPRRTYFSSSRRHAADAARLGSCDSKWACCGFTGVHQQGPKEMPTLLNICGPLLCREAPVTLISFHNRIILFLYCTKEFTKYHCTPDKKIIIVTVRNYSHCHSTVKIAPSVSSGAATSIADLRLVVTCCTCCCCTHRDNCNPFLRFCAIAVVSVFCGWVHERTES